MTAMAEIALTTERLSIGTVDPEDLVDLLSVRLSNPERLLRTEGSAGEPGRYDLGMLERDAMIASMDPARCLATVRRIEDGRVIGLLDLLVEHPEDGCPWIGAVEVLRSEQRRGYGRETLRAALDHLARERGGADVRALVDHDDEVAIAFLTACSFRPVGRRGQGVLMVGSAGAG